MWLVMKAPMTEVVYEVNSEMVLTKGQLLFEAASKSEGPALLKLLC